MMLVKADPMIKAMQQLGASVLVQVGLEEYSVEIEMAMVAAGVENVAQEFDSILASTWMANSVLLDLHSQRKELLPMFPSLLEVDTSEGGCFGMLKAAIHCMETLSLLLELLQRVQTGVTERLLVNDETAVK